MGQAAGPLCSRGSYAASALRGFSQVTKLSADGPAQRCLNSIMLSMVVMNRHEQDRHMSVAYNPTREAELDVQDQRVTKIDLVKHTQKVQQQKRKIHVPLRTKQGSGACTSTCLTESGWQTKRKGELPQYSQTPSTSYATFYVCFLIL